MSDERGRDEALGLEIEGGLRAMRELLRQEVKHGPPQELIGRLYDRVVKLHAQMKGLRRHLRYADPPDPGMCFHGFPHYACYHCGHNVQEAKSRQSESTETS